MRVSVVLCTHNEASFERFRDAADSVLAQTYPTELVVIVDGVSALAERVQRTYGGHNNVLIYCNNKNRGLLESRNTGVELASGDVVAFLDDDARAHPTWVEWLVETYENEDALAVGGRMVPEWVAGKPSFLPAEFYWLVGVTHRGFGPDGNEESEGEVRNTFGSNISFRREIFTSLGGFDPAIGGRKGDRNLQGGETELCARLRERCGEGVYYTPAAKVAHKVFEYRTKPRWLVDRAFWQGYSKRMMEELMPDSTGEESAFLRRLLGEFFPHRLRELFRDPTGERALQLFSLVGFTLLVGLGYGYAVISPPDRFER